MKAIIVIVALSFVYVMPRSSEEDRKIPSLIDDSPEQDVEEIGIREDFNTGEFDTYEFVSSEIASREQEPENNGNFSNQPSGSPFEIDFLMYTRRHTLKPELIVPEDLGARFINGSAHEATVIIFHGYTSNAYTAWVQDLKNELLSVGIFNVIAVNWEEGAKFPYNRAADNTRIVGQRTAELIQAIINQKNFPAIMIHLIGHSLGAHCAGFTGKGVRRLTGQAVRRISGLDPAGLFFIRNPPDQRLDRTDAIFVDVIHTNNGVLVRAAFGWKKDTPLGDVDFYPNGGSLQRGCPRLIPSSCSHLRATLLFTNSIRRCEYPTRLGAAECPPGRISGVKMGYFASRVNIGQTSYCLETSGQPPYCAVSIRP